MSAPSTKNYDRRDADQQFQRHEITEHFLTALEDVVWRYRVLSRDVEHADLHAEVITAEVAHQLAIAQSALHRIPLAT